MQLSPKLNERIFPKSPFTGRETFLYWTSRNKQTSREVIESSISKLPRSAVKLRKPTWNASSRTDSSRVSAADVVDGKFSRDFSSFTSISSTLAEFSTAHIPLAFNKWKGWRVVITRLARFATQYMARSGIQLVFIRFDESCLQGAEEGGHGEVNNVEEGNTFSRVDASDECVSSETHITCQSTLRQLDSHCWSPTRLLLLTPFFFLSFVDNRISGVGCQLQEAPPRQQARERRPDAGGRRLLTNKRPDPWLQHIRL